MRNLLRRSLALLPLLLLVVGTNVWVDPASLLNGSEKVAADILRRGRHVANYRDMDDRLVQKTVLKERSAPLDVLVVGSSRSMEIRADFFPGRALYNGSVSSGGLRDYLALYEVCRSRDLKPSLLLIGVDPWILNPSFETSRWRTLQSDYNRAAARLGLPADSGRSKARAGASKWLQLVSPSYFQSSVRAVLRQDFLTATEDPAHPSRMLLSDGSLKYPQAVIDRSPEEVHAGARRFAADRASAAFQNFDRLSPDAQAAFRTFLLSLRQDRVAPVLFLSPYHPEAFRELRTNPKFARVLEAESWFRTLAAELGVAVIGSFDPALAGCGEADFLDAIHVRGRAIRPLFAPVSDLRGR